jgi:cell division transport system ATP-binding protein
MTESEKVVVEAHNLNVFQQGNLVLSEVSFRVLAGEFVYLVGKTGSGKSSLLKMLYADLPVQTAAGKLSVCGYDMIRLKRSEVPALRRTLGIVFQDFQLLSDRSVLENLMFVLRATDWKDAAAMRQRCQEVLGMVDLGSKGQKLPFQLSGGEQQRLAIARALLNQPKLVLADEPTGNLDPQTSNDIVKLLRDLSKQGTAVIMASHDFSSIQKSPARMLSCDGGRLYDSLITL